MITAVDTNVLLDVFGADPTHGARSKEALRAAIVDGRVLACEGVWAEVTGFFPSEAGALAALGGLGVQFDAVDRDAALEAGRAWRAYRARGGPRTRVVADFLVGAHAARRADRLLTRDRGFYRSGFPALVLLDPGAPQRR